MVTGSFTGAEALAALKPLGFEVLRETDRIYVARGAMKFTLPKGEEYCNPNLNRIISDVVEDLKERAINAGRSRRDNRAPLMVVFDEKVFAVVEDRGANWQLQDLDNGNRFPAVKTRCVAYEPEPVEVKAVPEFTKRPATPPPTDQEKQDAMDGVMGWQGGTSQAARQQEPVGALNNPSSVAALVRLTRQRLESLKIEYEQALGKLELVRKSYDSTVDFLRSLGQEPEDVIVPFVELKRTVLPPPNGGSRPLSNNSVSPAFKDRFKMAWLDLGKPSGYGYMQKVKNKLAQSGVSDIPADKYLYAVMKEIKES